MKAAFLALLLSACATEREQAMAYHEPGFVPKRAVAVYVDDPHATCIALGVASYREGRRILACADAYGRILGQVCTMILPHGASDELEDHERLHCARGAWHD